jgi:hypothetical protein
MAEEKSLRELFWKKLNNLGDLKKLAIVLSNSGIRDDEPLCMFSDEEGNRVNGILTAVLYEEGLTFIPWEK